MQPSQTNGDMLNLDDDEPQALANGHAAEAPGPAPNAVHDPVAELMGLSLGGQPASVDPTTGQSAPNGEQGDFACTLASPVQE